MPLRKKTQSRILKPDFFARPTLTVCQELLGKYLVTPKTAHVITEVEAYDGPRDKASHASRGRTARNEAMFGPPGHWYVYLVYGMHLMLNIVTREEGYPAAILIRATSEIEGPGRLTRTLGINRSLNGLKAEPDSELWIEDRRLTTPSNEIIRTPRVGVDYAGEWAKKPWRFVWNEIEPLS